jgi:hypothetical protein
LIAVLRPRRRIRLAMLLSILLTILLGLWRIGTILLCHVGVLRGVAWLWGIGWVPSCRSLWSKALAITTRHGVAGRWCCHAERRFDAVSTNR